MDGPDPAEAPAEVAPAQDEGTTFDPGLGIWTAANILTLGRILLVPVIVVLLHAEAHWAEEGSRADRTLAFFAALFFLIASVTDFVDGRLARMTGTTSTMGKLLDPLADKLLMAGAAVMLVPLGRLEAWIAFAMIAREMFVTGLRSIASARGIVIAAKPIGKWKAFIQMAALNTLVLHYDYFDIPVHQVGTVAVYVAVTITLYSGWDYWRSFRPHVLD